MKELIKQIKDKIQLRRYDIDAIEVGYNEENGFSFEDSINIEFYQGMIEAYVDVLSIISIYEQIQEQAQGEVPIDAGVPSSGSPEGA